LTTADPVPSTAAATGPVEPGDHPDDTGRSVTPERRITDRGGQELAHDSPQQDHERSGLADATSAPGAIGAADQNGTYLRMRNRSMVASPDRVLLSGSKSVLARPGAEKRMPSPSSTGSRYTRISSTSPRCRHRTGRRRLPTGHRHRPPRRSAGGHAQPRPAAERPGPARTGPHPLPAGHRHRPPESR
jgi:hypothetical protein